MGAQEEAPEDASSHLMAVRAMVQRLNSATSSKTRGEDLCNAHYEEGNPKTNNCTDPTIQTMIEEDAQCEEAAELSCPDKSCIGDRGAGTDNFILDNWWYDKRPKRCFLSDDTPPKWFYNPSGFWPASIAAGTPVCVQLKYIDGTADSNLCDNDKYEIIMDEEKCRTYATCLNECVFQEFRELNASAQEAAPKGCHKTPSGCIRFNNMTLLSGAEPSQPKGIPVCEAKPATGGTAEGHAAPGHAAPAAAPAAAPDAAADAAAPAEAPAEAPAAILAAVR